MTESITALIERLNEPCSSRATQHDRDCNAERREAASALTSLEAERDGLVAIRDQMAKQDVHRERVLRDLVRSHVTDEGK